MPVDLDSEQKLDAEIRSWLAFALQKLDELKVLASALNHGRDVGQQPSWPQTPHAIASRRASPRVHNPAVKAAIARIDAALGQRVRTPTRQRADKQAAIAESAGLPDHDDRLVPADRRNPPCAQPVQGGRTRRRPATRPRCSARSTRSVREQEALGLDVLVHGEAERNDMVEYFGEQLDGYAFSQFGWVQSYGSRCVKPPILFGDISRPKAMTVEWIKYAQSLTAKPMKGMLTGPVTILNWSFVRDDQPRSVSCYQLALAIREEVLDLEKAGVRVIQIDEAALREGLPLRQSQWKEYLDGRSSRSVSPPMACRTKRRSTRTCAIRSSTTSSRRSPIWMPT